MDLLLGPVAGQPSSSASGGPIQIVSCPISDPVHAQDPPECSTDFSASTALPQQGSEIKRYRIWKKTKDPLSEEGILSNLNPVSVLPKNFHDCSSGKRTITISGRLCSFLF